MMKKWLSLLLAFLLTFTLAGCTAEEQELAGAVLDIVLEEVLEETDAPEEAEHPKAEPPAAQQIPTAAEPEKQEESAPGETPTAETPPAEEFTAEEPPAEELLPEDGSYTTKEDVALYIHTYGRLPDNFITKKEAEQLGWPGGSLEPYAPGMCIGGNRFGNYEGLLPEKKGRTYTECDIDTLGASKRGAKRIVFSNDGLIYYTDDHYESFELLYGEES